MAELVWDQTGERFYETGVDHGVLYIPDASGTYPTGVAWNGLVSVTETPSGAEANAQYADNIKYLNLLSAEEFGGTIEAFTYPAEFEQFDGLGSPSPGVTVGQQNRGAFGLSYRTRKGNDLMGSDFGYKLHLVYGCQVSPSERAYQTINDSPEPITFSWALTTSSVAVPGFKPTSILTVDSTMVDGAALADLEAVLYGTALVDPSLPLPAAVFAIMDPGATMVTATAPGWNPATDTVTIPAVTGVTYRIDGDPVVAGDIVITEPTLVTATPNTGYVLSGVSDDDWYFDPT